MSALTSNFRFYLEFSRQAPLLSDSLDLYTVELPVSQTGFRPGHNCYNWFLQIILASFFWLPVCSELILLFWLSPLKHIWVWPHAT